MADYWMHETSGIMRPVIERYLNRQPLSANDCAIMRTYLTQWIMDPMWRGPKISDLRNSVHGLTTREAISIWLYDALREGIDPL